MWQVLVLFKLTLYLFITYVNTYNLLFVYLFYMYISIPIYTHLSIYILYVECLTPRFSSEICTLNILKHPSPSTPGTGPSVILKQKVYNGSTLCIQQHACRKWNGPLQVNISWQARYKEWKKLRSKRKEFLLALLCKSTTKIFM